MVTFLLKDDDLKRVLEVGCGQSEHALYQHLSLVAS